MCLCEKIDATPFKKIITALRESVGVYSILRQSNQSLKNMVKKKKVKGSNTLVMTSYDILDQFPVTLSKQIS